MLLSRSHEVLPKYTRALQNDEIENIGQEQDNRPTELEEEHACEHDGKIKYFVLAAAAATAGLLHHSP